MTKLFIVKGQKIDLVHSGNAQDRALLKDIVAKVLCARNAIQSVATESLVIATSGRVFVLESILNSARIPSVIRAECGRMATSFGFKIEASEGKYTVASFNPKKDYGSEEAFRKECAAYEMFNRAPSKKTEQKNLSIEESREKVQNAFNSFLNKVGTFCPAYRLKLQLLADNWDLVDQLIADLEEKDIEVEK